MSVIQEKQKELRFIKRQNLDSESRMYGNMYHDLIHNYGIDCKYYKIQIPYPEQFKETLDENNIFLHGYGICPNPDYGISTEIISYMDVESDAFIVDKTGHYPDMDVSFYFDRTEFASKLAWKLGKLKEFKIDEKDVVLEIPSYTKEDLDIFQTEDVSSSDVSSCIPTKFVIDFTSDILSGKALVEIPESILETEYSVPVSEYQHSDGGVRFPINPDIAQSFYYNVDIHEYLDMYLFFKYSVHRVPVDLDERGNSIDKLVLEGKLTGSFVFRDITKISRYIESIHPDVGDIITIDFPDERSREQYEVTECIDKNLASDGLNPLLHKYIYKCKARRYINSGEKSPEQNEANQRMVDTHEQIMDSEEKILKKISQYDEDYNDAVYGGYERDTTENIRKMNESDGRPKFIDDGSFQTISEFSDQSKIVSDGFDLYFVDSEKSTTKLTMTRLEDNVPGIPQSLFNTIFTTDDGIYFRNIEGGICTLFDDKQISVDEYQMCCNALMDSRTVQDGNKKCDMILTFQNSKTIILSANGHLFARLGNKSKKMIKFV